MDWTWEDHMPEDETGERQPWYVEGEDKFEQARKSALNMNEAAKADFEDGARNGLALLLMEDGQVGATDLPESTNDGMVLEALVDMVSVKNVYGIIITACIETRKPAKNDHITKQLVLGEMTMNDLRPEDKRKSMVVVLTTREGRGLWVNNFFKIDSKATTQESLLNDAEGVVLEPSDIIEGDDWKAFYARSLNFWKGK